MNQDNSEIKLFSLNSNPELAQKIAMRLGVKLGNLTVYHFSDGEIGLAINESVRGCNSFIIQSISDPVNENFMELMLMIDALRRAGVRTINCVIPYYGYARADQKNHIRKPITAKLIANFLTMAGADRLITLDLHDEQLQGFFDIPVDNLLAIYSQADYLKKEGLDENIVVVAPDHSSAKPARNFAKYLKASFSIVNKQYSNQIDDNISVIGDVKNRRCVIFDDMIDSGSSMVETASILKRAGASEVYGCAAHAIFSGNAVSRLKNSEIKEVIVTDTIQIPREKKFAQLRILSMAPIFAKAISLIYHNQSVESLFN